MMTPKSISVKPEPDSNSSNSPFILKILYKIFRCSKRFRVYLVDGKDRQPIGVFSANNEHQAMKQASTYLRKYKKHL